MTWFPLSVVACLNVWLSATQPLPVECVVNPTPPAANLTRLQANSRSLDLLYEHAYSITVKVKAGRNGGSGILVQRRGQVYTVLTNRHVVRVGAPYVIQTPDGRSYPASLSKKVDFRDTDLALLQFRAERSYTIATLDRTNRLVTNDPVVSAGFPLEASSIRARGFLVTVGKVSLLPAQAFVGGYQIGYTNLIQQGMSGGPVLNLRGEVVGINSLHAYPLWGDPYIFQDGSKPTTTQRATIVQSSWAVSIATFLAAVKNAESKG